MKNKVYMNASLLYKNNRIISCYFAQSINDGPIELTYLPANKIKKLAWELKLAGGRKEVGANWYDPHVYSVEVYLILKY